jgi:hypothetical protein
MFERKVLRIICGPIQDNGAWRSRCNEEINILFKEPKLITVIKIGRLCWAGHVQHTGVDQLPKQLLHEKQSGRRNVGRPRARWLDEVNKDARKIRIRRWWSRALDREGWRTLPEEAETLNADYDGFAKKKININL